MTWMLTRTGHSVDLRYIAAPDIHIADIAHALAQINRFTGMACRPYSVAEHSLFVERLLERHLGITDPNVLMAGLLHDAHEAYFGDMSSPLKQMLNAASGNALRREEARVQGAVLQAFRVKTPFYSSTRSIHWADMTALSTERDALMPDHPEVWGCTREFPPVISKDFVIGELRDWTHWRDAYLNRFHALEEARRALAATYAVQAAT